MEYILIISKESVHVCAFQQIKKCHPLEFSKYLVKMSISLGNVQKILTSLLQCLKARYFPSVKNSYYYWNFLGACISLIQIVKIK